MQHFQRYYSSMTSKQNDYDSFQKQYNPIQRKTMVHRREKNLENYLAFHIVHLVGFALELPQDW